MDFFHGALAASLIALSSFFSVPSEPILGGTLLFPTGGGTGVGSVTAGNLIYGNGTAPFGSVATTTLTASSPLSLSQPVAKVGFKLHQLAYGLPALPFLLSRARALSTTPLRQL
jgi:hypothetical protein